LPIFKLLKEKLLITIFFVIPAITNYKMEIEDGELVDEAEYNERRRLKVIMSF